MKATRERALKPFKAGDTFTLKRTFREEEITRFAEVGGDYNPAHFDGRFAAVKGFPTPIMHGLLTGGMVSEIGGQLCLLAAGVEFKFKKPVFPGDTVTLRFTVTELGERNRGRADLVFTNQEGTVVLEGHLKFIAPGEEERRVIREMLAEGDPTNLRKT